MIAMGVPRNMHNAAILPLGWLFVEKSCLNNSLGIFFLGKTYSRDHKENVPSVLKVLPLEHNPCFCFSSTPDWVVLFFEDDEKESQCTAEWEILEGRRLVRGREAECLHSYEKQTASEPEIATS
jgi:hypothetical protein